MRFPLPSRGFYRTGRFALAALWAVPLLITIHLHPASAHAQTASPADNAASIPNSPASVPAGITPAIPHGPTSTHEPKAAPSSISAKQAREADDAYLEGARQVEHKNLAAAVRSFQQAVHLNPLDRDYALALIVTREQYVTQLVQHAAAARSLGNIAEAETLLTQARKIDPDNRVVSQHFGTNVPVSPETATKPPPGPGLYYSSNDPMKFPAQNIASTLRGAMELDFLPGKRDVHLHGDPQSVIRGLYGLYGITTTFDTSVSGGTPVSLDMDNVAFRTAARVLDITAHIFAVPLQPKSVLIAADTQENRNALMPQVEETVYLPGHPNEEMQELANLARNIFDIKQVTASPTGGYLLLRGDANVLRQVNAVYDDMLDGNPEVLFDVNLYEFNKTSDNNIGATLPASVGVFSIAAEAQSLVSANQSLLNQAIAAGLLTLSGSPLQNLLTEVGFLVASGTVSASQYTNLLGMFGGGLTLAGLYLGSNASFNMALKASDVRLLDTVQIRSTSHQPVNFRAGTRYPVITATYSSGVSSSLASSLAGININGTSASSLLSQFLGRNSVNVPQFQYEDLGITLKMTPEVLHSDEVRLALDMKIEALAGSSVNSIPVLNNRALTSTITVPAGYTAMLAAVVTTSETKAILGLPGLSE
jgi:general secretion pathway protein D